MATWRLKAGQRVEADRDKPVLDAEGKPTGRFRDRTVKAGGTFESDLDHSGEPERYELVAGSPRKAKSPKDVHGGLRTPGDPTPEVAETSPAVAPAGQVSTGFQKTGGGFASPTPSGPMDPDEAAEHGAALEPAGEGDGGDLSDKTVEELKQIADDEEVEAPAHARKADLLKAIRKHRQQK